MKSLVSKVFLLVLLSTALPAVGGEELVLIVSARSTIEPLDSSTVRKLFLGLTINQRGHRLRPALNEADAHIKELFLQNVVAMSDSTYDRYVLRLSLMRGQTQPLVYRSSDQAIDAVASEPDVVSYAWAHEVAHDPRIKVLRILWHD